MTIPLQDGLVYGPVKSRRLGASLGVNIIPDGRKVCNFNCAYCQYGWTPASGKAVRVARDEWPTAESIAAAVDGVLARSGAIDRITLAGNGEPTLHPEFARIVELLRAVRDRRAKHARLVVLSNSSTVDDPAVIHGLRRLDERYMKLDAGDAATLRKINGTTIPVERIVSGLASLSGVVLQALFTRDAAGKVDNTTPGAIARWLAAVKRVRPLAVHVYTIDRSPAWKPLQKIPREELTAIGERVRGIGFEAVVF